jgi:hypothetical protein
MTAALPAGRGKNGLRDALAAQASAEIGRLAAEAARSLGCDAGLEAAEAVIRAGMLKLGGGMLGELLAADPGYRGPRVPCGQGHEAELVSCRDKTSGTVLGPVTLTRAWYHCGRCGPGLAPRDAELGIAGQSLSPGLATMNDRAAADGPFAKARCKWFRSRGLFAGSGVVEAGCKSVIGQRLKLSGMRWTVAGADAIIALRCREASSQQETVCNRPRTQTGAA